MRITGVDEVVCAIPDEGRLYEEAAKYGPVFIGPEQDVLARYYQCAEAYEADIIMRITGDCPLISPELCGEVLKRFKESDTDYASNIDPRTFPRGLDCEVFGFGILGLAYRQAIAPEYREHVTPWIRRAAIRPASVQSPWPIEGRCCIDTQDDYNVIKAYFDESRQHLRAA